MRRRAHGVQITSIVLVFAILCLFLPSSPVSAGWVSSTDAIGGPKARLVNFLEREDIVVALQDLGVDPLEAKRRVAGLTDAEAQMALDHLDEMPAGGGVLTTLIVAFVLVFLVLLLTDILGFTDVFPFVKKTVH